MFKNALVSVYNKENIHSFLEPFSKKGMRILSTGGTSIHLKSKGFSVLDVSEQTKFPEVMGNRVKTLHPFIHMCLLAREECPEDLERLKQYALKPIDLLVVNLYPFLEKALHLKARKQADWIDIGGPTLLRAAAKNYFRITVVCDPEDYSWILEKEGRLTEEDRKSLAVKAFSHVALYDSMIADEWRKSLEERAPLSALHSPKKQGETNFLQKKGRGLLKERSWSGVLIKELRYGENPHQRGFWYKKPVGGGLQDVEVLQGKPLSYNNLLDLDSALKVLFSFKEDICSVAVKHNNPCGVSCGSSTKEALLSSLQADPMSVFGGVLALNQVLDETHAECLESVFLECLLAKDFSKKFLDRLKKKKNLRLLRWSSLSEFASSVSPSSSFSHSSQIKSLLGGFLLQGRDQVEDVWNKEWELCGEAPREEIKKDLLMAWKVSAHLKSNAIALVADQTTVGLGMGQVNRVDAVEQAIDRMKRFHPKTQDTVLASDAFFPFPDSIEKAAQGGIRWIIQPGGALRDEEVKKRAQELGVTLVMTKKRHFLH